MGQLSRNKYRVLLLALLALLVGYPASRTAAGSAAVYNILMSGVFLSALFVVFDGTRFRLLALALAVPTAAGVWTGYALPGLPARPVDVGFHLVAALFLVLAIGVILRGVYRETAVTTDGVCGALCGYVLAGLVFGHLFCLVEILVPGSFVGSPDVVNRLGNRGDQHFLLSYFSLTTITTAGFGDIAPGTDAGRAFAMVEAVVGQFYIAVLVADLVGKKLSRPAPPEPS